jgi:hypothetical protein
MIHPGRESDMDFEIDDPYILFPGEVRKSDGFIISHTSRRWEITED